MDGQPDWHHFDVGDAVVLRGLSAMDLNGLRGRIEKRVVETVRLAVRLDDGGGLKSVRPANLRLYEEAEDEDLADIGGDNRCAGSGARM